MPYLRPSTIAARGIALNRQLPLLLVLGLAANAAYASTDDSCSPTWTLTQARYSNCSNLPFLTPSNDNRVNLALMLADQQHVTLKVQPRKDDGMEYGYSLVPFTPAALIADLQAALAANPKQPRQDPQQAAADSKPSGANQKPAAADPKPAAADQKAAGADPKQAAAATDQAAEGDDDTASSYGTGEGTRCSSNADGATAFINALHASTDVPQAERKTLEDARQTLPATCEAAPAAAIPVPAGIQSALGRQFAAYLAGAGAFYNGDYAAALASFNTLADSPQPWLKETARYMIGRTELNLAQRDAFDQYGYFDTKKVDPAAAAAAKAGFTAYLAQYPTGDYAASARGLMRRVYWLSGQAGPLAEEFQWQFAHADSPQHTRLATADLINEADGKLLSNNAAPLDQVRDPRMLAVLDLMGMRAADDNKRIPLSAIESQQASFAGSEDLYNYLLAAHALYVRNDADNALKLLPSTQPDHPLDYLEFSRQTLRGLALENKGDWSSASQQWLKLLPVAQQPLQNAQLQLALAINYEQSGNLAKVYAIDSPIKDAAIRDILLRNDAGRDLLLDRVHATAAPKEERDLALFVLLYKDLMRGRYADFLTDYALLPADLPKPGPAPRADADAGDAAAPASAYGPERPLNLFLWAGTPTNSGYACPALPDIAQTLKQNPKAPQALNCLGEFVRTNDLDGLPLDQPQIDRAHGPSAHAPLILGSMPSQFGGNRFSRLEGYKTIIATPGADAETRAYALYRAVNCYGPSGYNGCGGDEVEPPARKAWFQMLKTQYANSAWAKKQRYYW
jgi:hypothetical protein